MSWSLNNKNEFLGSLKLILSLIVVFFVIVFQAISQIAFAKNIISEAFIIDDKSLTFGVQLVSKTEMMHLSALDCEKQVISTNLENTSTRVTMYRLYNKYTGEHFYTSDSQEKTKLVNGGWTDEGTGWIAPSTSNTPVYRLYNPYVSGGDHHYTTSKDEYEKLSKVGWNKEGVGWYSANKDENSIVALYRQYNPYAQTGTHNYTKETNERDALVKIGWKDEKVAWYGYDKLAKSIDFGKAQVDLSNKTFENKQLRPSVTISGLKNNIDYVVSYGENFNVGKGSITVKGIGDYCGEKRWEFKIEQKPINFESAVVDVTDKVCTGKQLCPEAKISSLKKNEDYTVSYGENVDPDKGTVTLTGIGNYCGERKWEFNITLPAYWMAPASKTTTGNTTETSNQDNPNYTNPEKGIIKNNEIIKDDITKIRQGDKTTFKEYTKYMENDSYHLYTKWNGYKYWDTSGKDNYVEFRIVQVGEHDEDGTGVTFQATHALPSSYNHQNNMDNDGSWKDSKIRELMQEGGDIYSNFDESFTTDIATVSKLTGQGTSTDGLTETSDRIWLMSPSEFCGGKCYANEGEGSKYSYWNKIGIEQNQNNPALTAISHRRNGGDASGTASGGINWTRSARKQDSGSFCSISSKGDPCRYDNANIKYAVTPTFAMKGKVANYKVEHYQENLDGTFSTSPVETEVLSDTIGVKTKAVCKVYKGFSSKEFSQETIAENGSTVVKIYYTRNYYTVTFNVDGRGQAPESQTLKFGSNVQEPTNPTYNDLTFAGWYMDSTLTTQWDFNSDVVSDNATLYAWWRPASNSYWLSPASKITTENVDKKVNQTNKSYNGEEKNIKKTSSEIRADITKIRQGNSTVIAEYKKYMTDDNFHLYAKIGQGQSVNDYVEFRIIEVGDHDGDTSGVTFQAIHSLPVAYEANENSKSQGGWSDSTLRNKLQRGGEIYNLFGSEFTKAIAIVEKKTGASNTTRSISKTNDTFWLPSSVELCGQTCQAVEGEGAEYDFWKRLGISYNSLEPPANPALAPLGKTRNNENVSGVTLTDAVWWLRTPVSAPYVQFSTVQSTGALKYAYSSVYSLAVCPCFTMDGEFANYTVEHYKQNDDLTYPKTPTQTETLSGTVGKLTKAEAKDYEGYTAQAIQQKTIVDDGSTVVKVYYEKNNL